MTIADKLKQAAAVKAFDYIGKDPEHNIPKVLEMLKKIDDTGSLKNHIAGISKNFEDPENGMRKLALNIFAETDEGQLKKVYEELAVNSMIMTSSTAKS
jgi:hypothetical protein